MRTITISQTGVGVSSICRINYLIPNAQFNAMAIVTGTATYTIQYTSDDIDADSFNPSTADWYTFGTAAVNSTVSQIFASNMMHSGIRINITSGTGTVVVKVCLPNIANKSSTKRATRWA
jgi:hypothetical protein